MAYRIFEPCFSLGKTVATPAVMELGVDLAGYMRRHHCGDWGDLCEEDKQANEDALVHGDRILSHYKLTDGRRIYIITEADRSSTCILLPEEY
jgi:hypothetical protein